MSKAVAVSILKTLSFTFLNEPSEMKSVQNLRSRNSQKERQKMKRIVTGVLIVLTLTALTFAQTSTSPRQGPPTGQRGQRPDLFAGLKTALNLTDAQVTAIQALNQTRQTRAEEIMTEIRQRRQALDALLDAATPNPTDVGNGAIALRVSERKLAAERDWFITELKKLLTGEQQQKLDTLLAANPRLPFLGGGPGPGGPGRGPGPGRDPRPN
jgi:Spy/CpxP family protein refolding chaperone